MLSAALVGSRHGQWDHERRSARAGSARLDRREQQARAGRSSTCSRASRRKVPAQFGVSGPRRGGDESRRRTPANAPARQRKRRSKTLQGEPRDRAEPARAPGPRHPDPIGADQPARRPAVAGTPAALHRRDGARVRRAPRAARSAGRPRAPARGGRPAPKVRRAGIEGYEPITTQATRLTRDRLGRARELLCPAKIGRSSAIWPTARCSSRGSRSCSSNTRSKAGANHSTR